MDHTKLQDDSEVECVSKFIVAYNEAHGTNFTRIKKNQIQDEVDVFCYDEKDDSYIKVQVKKADPRIARDLGKSRDIPLPLVERRLITRDQNQAESSILGNITQVENKYKKQNKDVSEVILVLDEILNPPDLILHQIRNKITASSFKEIWLVRRNDLPYRLFP